MNFFSSLSSKIEYKRFRITKQEWAEHMPVPIAEVSKDPSTFFKSLTEAERAVFNYLLVWSNSYKSIYFSQSTIAQDLGYSRGFVNRTLKIFEAAGLIASNYRHKRSNEYKLTTWLKAPEMRKALSRFFKAFVWFPIALLSVQFSGSVTQEISHISKYNHVSNPYRDKVYNITGLQAELARMLTKVGDLRGKNPIPQVIRDLSELNLTKWGQIKLCAFPDKAIEHAKKEFKFAGNATDKFRWFFKVCQVWCDDNQIRPNWQRVQLLEREFDAPLHANMTLEPKKAMIVKRPVRTKQPDLPVIYAKANFERAEKENNYQHKVKVNSDAERVANMTQQEAEAYAAQLITINPSFGGIAARAFLGRYKQAQDKKNAAV